VVFFIEDLLLSDGPASGEAVEQSLGVPGDQRPQGRGRSGERSTSVAWVADEHQRRLAPTPHPRYAG
jgi:hypothetical protein